MQNLKVILAQDHFSRDGAAAEQHAPHTPYLLSV
jgi:hypothetical protein